MAAPSVSQPQMSATQKVQQHPAFIQAQDKANYYVNQLDKELTKATLSSVVYSSSPFSTPSTLWLPPVSILVGWLLPAFLSVKAIESPAHNDDIQWLTYWVVFGFFTFTESVALRLVLHYLPWYYALKSVFILWLQLPAFRGAETIYGHVVRPVFVNVSKKTGSSNTSAQPAPSAKADSLRERVAQATSE
ncbi:hypothetical protein NLI96_g4768 [Meripilus lineatus]|uniref:Protein YOP1 n=1 Tax=Meripilus lineatus TaxID=2056292 RepID=A0AAD5V3Z4_9APHY|nr:hypothetical protein NLI96_g4768 [Physisporinus lineatus]